jgi:hypothetical protein
MAANRTNALRVAMFDAHRKAAINATTYRQKAMVLLVTAFAPLAGSLIALVTTGDYVGAPQLLALRFSLLLFVFVTVPTAVWMRGMGTRHVRHRETMSAILDARSADAGSPASEVAWLNRSSEAWRSTGGWLWIALLVLAFLMLVGGMWAISTLPLYPKTN